MNLRKRRILALMAIPILLALWILITFVVLSDRPLLDRLLPQAVGVGAVFLLRSLLRVIES